MLGVAVVGALAIIALFALNLGPFSTSTPTPIASTTPLPSDAPSNAPTASTVSPLPSTSATPTSPPQTPSTTPATPEEALLAHVPDAIRPTCSVHPGNGQALLVADCTSDDGSISVGYSVFGDPDSLEQAFTSLRVASQIEPDSGNCADYTTWPAEGTYSASGGLTGRFLCTDEPGSMTIYWTDAKFLVLGVASDQTPDLERLIDFWQNEAGPAP